MWRVRCDVWHVTWKSENEAQRFTGMEATVAEVNKLLDGVHILLPDTSVATNQ
jgi:hypothetical protein